MILRHLLLISKLFSGIYKINQTLRNTNSIKDYEY